MTTLPERYHDSTYPLRIAQEEPRRRRIADAPSSIEPYMNQLYQSISKI
jgi:hypothetical protein